MKKAISIIFALTLSLSAFAAVIGSQKAVNTAKEFFRDNGKESNSTLTLVRTGYQTTTKSPIAISSDPTYYVYNRKGGGWVILAADDSVDPLIGYSMTGEFPSDKVLPGGLGWWLDVNISNQIAYGRAHGWVMKASSSSKGDVLKAGDGITYETATWDQGSPYNGESPAIEGHATITGCVATAASIKCRYHEWPYKGSGTTPAYKYRCNDLDGKEVTIPSNTLGRIYDYDNMPLRYTSSSNSTQKAAVAALMHDMGTGCKMMYGWTGSGAYTEDLAYSLRTYFHYDKNLHHEYRMGFNDDTWIEMLKKELDEIGPIICGGYDPSPGGGGHQFIFDGYNGSSQFRVNWGWSGNGNGWFRITNLDGYSEQQDAILGCKPDRNGIYTPDEVAEKIYFKYNNNIATLSCGENYNLFIENDKGTAVFSKTKVAKDTKITFTKNDLGGAGSYTVTVEFADVVAQFPDSKYKFEIVF